MDGRRNKPPELMEIVGEDFRRFGEQCIGLAAEFAYSSEQAQRQPKPKPVRGWRGQMRYS